MFGFFPVGIICTSATSKKKENPQTAIFLSDLQSMQQKYWGLWGPKHRFMQMQTGVNKTTNLVGSKK